MNLNESLICILVIYSIETINTILLFKLLFTLHTVMYDIYYNILLKKNILKCV